MKEGLTKQIGSSSRRRMSVDSLEGDGEVEHDSHEGEPTESCALEEGTKEGQLQILSSRER